MSYGVRVYKYTMVLFSLTGIVSLGWLFASLMGKSLGTAAVPGDLSAAGTPIPSEGRISKIPEFVTRFVCTLCLIFNFYST